MWDIITLRAVFVNVGIDSGPLAVKKNGPALSELCKDSMVEFIACVCGSFRLTL